MHSTNCYMQHTRRCDSARLPNRIVSFPFQQVLMPLDWLLGKENTPKKNINVLILKDLDDWNHWIYQFHCDVMIEPAFGALRGVLSRWKIIPSSKMEDLFQSCFWSVVYWYSVLVRISGENRLNNKTCNGKLWIHLRNILLFYPILQWIYSFEGCIILRWTVAFVKGSFGRWKKLSKEPR